jgi:hypothetical protein
MRSLCLAALLVALTAISAFASPLSMQIEGEVDFDLDLNTVSSEWACELSWKGSWANASFSTAWENVTWTDLQINGDLSLEGVSASFTMAFDPEQQVFGFAETTLEMSVVSTDIEVQTRNEPGGMGIGLNICDSESPWLDILELGLNLDAFGGLVQTDSCTLPFTFARIGMSMQFDEACSPIRWEATWTQDGFQDIWFEWGPVNSFLPGVRLGGQLTFTLDSATARVTPSLSLTNTPGMTVFAGLVWDDATHAITGYDIYGFDIRCDIAGVNVRSIIAFEPGKISLVPAPYTQLFGLVWTFPTSCSEETGKVSISTYLGDSGLLGIGKVVVTLKLPLRESLIVFAKADCPVGTPLRLSLAWEATF